MKKKEIKHNDWLLADIVHKKQIVALYFEFANAPKFYNLGT